MKAKKNKKLAKEPVAPVMEAIAVKEEPKTWVINCPKCGAALSVKEGGYAYMCPVCSTLLRMKTSARLVKDLGGDKKNLHVVLTENAVNYLVGKNMAYSANPKNPPLNNLEFMIAKNLAGGYTREDSIVVDIDANGLNVKKS